MIFLIITVFIAQLVILVNIVSWLYRADGRVRTLSAVIETENPKLEKCLKAINQITEDFIKITPLLDKKLIKTRNNFIIRAVLQFAQGGVLLFFKPKYKKLIIGAKLGFEVIKNLSKSKNML